MILDIFFIWTDATQTALQRYSDFNNPSNCSLTKVQNNLAKELLRTITVTVPLVLPDYQPMLLSQRNLKNLQFSQKVAVFTRNRTNKQLWQKSRFRFDCKNTTFCEHHKYKQKSQIDWCYGFMKTSFRSCFKSGTFSTNATKR